MRKEQLLILMLFVLRSCSRFYFRGCFPFFNDNEDLHFDLIAQYSTGRLPRTLDVRTNEFLILEFPELVARLDTTLRRVTSVTFVPPIAGPALALIEPEASRV